MAKKNQYKNPPLVEVFCEFFFQPPEEAEWDVLLLTRFWNKIRTAFPKRENLKAGIEVSVREGEGSPKVRFGPPTPQYRFRSADNKTLVQIGENLLAVNRLPPDYEGWGKFEPVVASSFSHYLQVWKPSKLVRAAVHYIDKIDIPKREIELADYFTLYPVFPEKPKTLVTNVLLSYEAKGANEGDVVVFTMKQMPSANPHGVSFFVTFDYVATGGLALKVESVKRWITNAHDHLHELFENTFTNECKKLWD
jgi:uncharacterized protein (TIGR04255 family)